MEKPKEENLPSPDTVLGDYLRNSESETESSKASTSELETLKDPKPPASSSSSWWWFEFLHLFKSNKSKKYHNKFSSSMSMREEQISDLPNPPMVDVGLNYFRPQWKNFTLSDLQTATNNFCKGQLELVRSKFLSFTVIYNYFKEKSAIAEYLIGKGGYAQVFKGCLQSGQLVAIKRLTRGPTEERIGDFLSELGIMAHVNHANTAKMIGYGVEGGLFLVLELSPHGSLASFLHSQYPSYHYLLHFSTLFLFLMF